MKDIDLIKAIGNIDDDLILDAEETRNDKKKILKDASFAHSVSGFRWKVFVKSAVAIAACFALVFGIGTFGGIRMGASKAADTEASYDGGFSEQGSYAVADMEMPKEENMMVDPASYKVKAMGTDNGVFEPAVFEQKLVYTAYLDLETEDYDQSYSDLTALVESLDGYFENSEVYNGSYYRDASSKSGYFSIRIPTEKYNDFMSSVSSSWHVVSKNESINDISNQYYDTVDRLDTLKIKEERLEELLKSASSMSDIIELENSLADTQSQIEYLTRDLKYYDKQVDYSTVSINLYQVTKMGDTVGSEGFGERIIRSLKNGARNFAEGIADLIAFASYNLISIAIIVVLVILAWKFHIVRKIINWIKK